MLLRLRLAKVPLCAFIWLSTMFGYALALVDGWLHMVLLGAGVFLLAAGGATLNNLQESGFDGEMLRTRSRPLVQGQISRKQAAWQAGILIVAGLLVIFLTSASLFVLAVSLAALILYNGIYTPLKRVTIWSIIPGALCGALPPYIGWLGAGGGVFSYPAALVFSLFVLWQVPHFWLVMLSFKGDYLGSQVPNLLAVFDEHRVKRFFVTWMGALVITMLMFLTLYPYHRVWVILIICNCLLLLVVFTIKFFIQANRSYPLLFAVLNSAILIHMVVLTIGMRISF